MISCQISIKTVAVVHQQYQLHKHLTIRKKMKCLLCKTLGSACACHRLLHSPRCLNKNVFIVLSKSERAFVALCFSLCKCLCAKRRTAHTAALCECVILLWIKLWKRNKRDICTSALLPHLLLYMVIQTYLPFTHSLFKVTPVWKDTEHLLTLCPWTNESHSRTFTYTICTHPGEHLIVQKSFKTQGAWMDCWIMLNFWIPFAK